MDEELLLNELEQHDIEYQVSAVVDGEVIRTISDKDFEVVSSELVEGKLEQAINDFVMDIVISKQEDYLDQRKDKFND